MKLFVGNLSWNATEETLKPLFEAFGRVISVRIVADPYTGRSKGFGFVEMEDESAGEEAMRQLHDSPFLNRPLRVSKARQEQGGNGGGHRQGRGGFSPRGGGEERRPRRSHYDEHRNDH